MKLRLDRTDRLRLSIHAPAQGETVSWTATPPYFLKLEDFIYSGPFATGAMGIYLREIFLNPSARFEFVSASGKLLEYSFETPLDTSENFFRSPGEWHRAGYEGSLWIDPQTSDDAIRDRASSERSGPWRGCRSGRFDDSVRPARRSAWKLGDARGFHIDVDYSKSSEMIRALIFDLGGVVIPFDFQKGYAAMERHCPFPAAEIPKRIRSTGLVPLFETGQIEARAFVEGLTRALQVSLSYKQFCELWSAIFLPGTLIPVEFLDRLRARYRLIALSNTNELHFAEVRSNYPAIQMFEHLVLSYLVGCAKPQPRIYAEAVTRAGCPAAECLFIDDVEAYVEGARAAGLNAIRFEDFPHLEEDLARFGIL